MIWSFKRKRKPDRTITKYKARLCCHGIQQEWGVNYWDTYSSVVSWFSVRISMTLAKLHNLHTKSIDFVQAFPQAKVKSTIFLQTPSGLEVTGDKELVLRLIKNLYGLKGALDSSIQQSAFLWPLLPQLLQVPLNLYTFFFP